MNKVGNYFLDSEGNRYHYLGMIKPQNYLFYSEKQSGVVVINKIPQKEEGFSTFAKSYLKSLYPQRGECFVGTDDKMYAFIKPANSKYLQIEFIEISTRNVFSSAITFIKEKKGEIDQITANEFEFEKGSKNPSLEEMVKTGLTSFKNCFKEFESAEIIEVGPILQGDANDHETDLDYLITGLVIKYRTAIKISNELFVNDEIGFFAIKINEEDLKKGVSYNFFESNASSVLKSNSFCTGYGDNLEVLSTIHNQEKVLKALADIDLKYYEKR